GGGQALADHFVKLVQGGLGADGDVELLSDDRGVLDGGGEEVGLDDVGDVAEIAAGGAVAIDEDGGVFNHRGDPLGNDGGVGAVGVLARTEDVEVTQADALDPVAFAKDIG